MSGFENYDAWLEAPYQRREAENDQFIAWCEENDHDPETTEWAEYEQAMQDAEDDYYAERAEAANEDAYFEADYDRY